MTWSSTGRHWESCPTDVVLLFLCFPVDGHELASQKFRTQIGSPKPYAYAASKLNLSGSVSSYKMRFCICFDRRRILSYRQRVLIWRSRDYIYIYSNHFCFLAPGLWAISGVMVL
jgi:hypothetical protein